MQLRNYQSQIINDTRQAYKKGFKAPCIVLGCGGGKSILAAELAKQTTLKQNNLLFIVHREELQEQIINTFKWWGVDMQYCDVVMVGTFANRLPNKNYKLIITDENHHAPANSYLKIYQHYPNSLKLGLTATPIRNDGKGLIDTNDKLIFSVSTKWLIDNGYLAPYKYYAPKFNINLNSVEIDRGDYNVEQLEKILNKKKIYSDVIASWKQYALNKKTIVYCVNVNHSILTANAFNQAGIVAAHIDGTTPKTDRKQIFEDFKSGKITVLTNCNVFSEGIDIPDVECCLLLRPTTSLTLYIQSSMRCMRFKPNKTAIIIDCVGNVFRHDLPDADHDWKLEKPKVNKKEVIQAEVKARQCTNCFEVYSGTSRICPYCEYDNGLTPKQIKEEKEAELQEIKRIEKFNKKKEIWDAKTYNDLLAIEKARGYKFGWAKIRWEIIKNKK
jgi:superfamily II DNA or RNA helicase